MTDQQSSSPAHRNAWFGVGAVLMVLCCAGPALIAGGALAAVGGFFANPLVIAVGVLLVALAIAAALRGRSLDRTVREPRPASRGDDRG